MTTKPDFNDVLQKALSEFDERKQAEKERLENALTLWDAVSDVPSLEWLADAVKEKLEREKRGE